MRLRRQLSLVACALGIGVATAAPAQPDFSVMRGIGGAAMEIVQQQRITLLP